MSNPFKPIAISLIPNFSLADFFQKETPRPANLILFENGRAAAYFLLKALGIGSGDEVIIQAFTCVAVPNSVSWTGAKPVFVDIDESLNMDPDKMVAAITPKTKAVIWQSTLGDPGQMEKAREICKKKKIYFIEDGAHSGKIVGDLGFLSFGRDKVISGVFGGGAVVAKRKIPVSDLSAKNYSIFYPLITYFILQTYSFFSLGKALHKLLKNSLPKVLTAEEKQGEKPERFYVPPPKILVQWDRLDEFINHRRKIAKFYVEQLGLSYNPECSYLRFNIFVPDPSGLRSFAAKQNVFLGDWYDNVVAPRGVNLEKIGYKPGSCPKAEEVCKRIVNLPTNPNMSLDDAKKVVEIVKLWKK